MFRRTMFGVTLAPIFAGLVALAGYVAEHEANRADEAAIRECVQAYFDGMMQGEPERLQAAFHEDAYLIGITRNGLTRIPFGEWSARMTRPIPNPDQFHNRIVSVDMNGLAAVAKTDLDWPSVHYVDYLSLLKIDGEWKIVNKIWHQGPGREQTPGA